MFIHIKSELFREHLSDCLADASQFVKIAIRKEDYKGRLVFAIKFLDRFDNSYCELYSTEEKLRIRIKEVLALIGKNTAVDVNEMANTLLLRDDSSEK